MLRLLPLALLMLAACEGDSDPHKQPPVRSAGWEIGPVMDGQNYSPNCPDTFDTAFTVGPCEPHYVTRATGPLTDKRQIRLRFRIEGDKLYGASPECNKGPASLDIHFSSDVPGKQWETGRWWASFTTTSNLGPGEYEVVAPLNARWTGVIKSNSVDNPAEWREALAKASRVGFTFGDCTGRGHGVGSFGQTRFTVLEWAVE